MTSHNGKKALFKLMFCYEIIICQPIFKNFVALFKTFWMQNDDNITLAGGVSGQGDIQKGSFQRRE